VVPTLDLMVMINTGLYKSSLQRVVPSAILNQFVLKAGRHPVMRHEIATAGTAALVREQPHLVDAEIAQRASSPAVPVTVDSSLLGKSHQAIAEAIADQTLSNESVSMDGRLVPRPLDRVESRVLHFGLD
jgi:hypothetical protein